MIRKTASPKRHTQFKTRGKNQTLFETKLDKIDSLFMTKVANNPYAFRLYIPVQSIQGSTPGEAIPTHTLTSLVFLPTVGGKGLGIFICGTCIFLYFSLPSLARQRRQNSCHCTVKRREWSEVCEVVYFLLSYAFRFLGQTL